MKKWKFINKTKEKDASLLKGDNIVECTLQPHESSTEVKPQTTDRPIKVYTETLFTTDPTKKQIPLQEEQAKKPYKRTSWENSSTIERNVDAIVLKHTAKKQNPPKSNDLNSIVDDILSKKKKMKR